MAASSEPVSGACTGYNASASLPVRFGDDVFSEPSVRRSPGLGANGAPSSQSPSNLAAIAFQPPASSLQLLEPTRHSQSSRNRRNLLKTNDRLPVYPAQFSSCENSSPFSVFSGLVPTSGPAPSGLPYVAPGFTPGRRTRELQRCRATLVATIPIPEGSRKSTPPCYPVARWHLVSLELGAVNQTPLLTNHIHPVNRYTRTIRNARKSLKTNARAPFYSVQFTSSGTSPLIRLFAHLSTARQPKSLVLPFTTHESRVTSHGQPPLAPYHLPLPW
jgi:hypothetical protein